jgi:flagellar biosynthesis protein FlhA
VRKRRLGPVVFPLAVIGVVAMLVVPMPTPLLDVLLTINIAASVIVLLAAMSVSKPLELSSFPSLLLIATLFRLSLNVTTTRLILGQGDAGEVVEAFGSFVVGGSIVVGLVVFLILIVIQFVVITSGATRVAEVGARFTLDAMPGKQMAIDADLSAGIIDEAEARRRREAIAAEADFYGAMDGSSKFVKGDAIAAVIITAINLFGGFLIGVIQDGLPIPEAIDRYSILTVGDGLVSQIPALLISISSGLIVTRAAGTADLGSDVFDQFRRQHRVLRLGGLVIVAFAVVPGLPKLPFIAVGGACWLLGRRLGARMPDAHDQLEAGGGPDGSGSLPALPARSEAEDLADDMRVEPISLQLSVDLVDMVDPSVGGDLLDRVKALRRKLAMELGVIIPPVRTRDNLELPQSTYVLSIHGVEISRGAAMPGQVLVIGDALHAVPGDEIREPVFGLPAKWIPATSRAQADMLGLTVVDRPAVVTTHLAEVVRNNASSLLARQDVKRLIDMVKETDPAVVEDLSANQVTVAEVQRVLQELLDEGVSIRDLVRVLEAIGERARHSRDPQSLTEAARRALGPAISAAYASDGRLSVLTLDPLLERTMQESLRAGEDGVWLALDPDPAIAFTDSLRLHAHAAEEEGHRPVLVCSGPLRSPLHRLVRSMAGAPPVLALDELGDQLTIESLGTVNLGQPAHL